MQATETLTAHACTVHNRVLVTSLNVWISLNYPQVAMVFEEATFIEAACDYCMLTASRSRDVGASPMSYGTWDQRG